MRDLGHISEMTKISQINLPPSHDCPDSTPGNPSRGTCARPKSCLYIAVTDLVAWKLVSIEEGKGLLLSLTPMDIETEGGGYAYIQILLAIVCCNTSFTTASGHLVVDEIRSR